MGKSRTAVDAYAVVLHQHHGSTLCVARDCSLGGRVVQDLHAAAKSRQVSRTNITTPGLI